MRASTCTHTQLCTQPFNSESSLALCKLDREREYDNKQPYAHSMRNNIWSFLSHLIFCAVLYFPACWALWKCSCSRRDTPPPHTHTCPPYMCTSLCVVWRVLMQPKYKAWSMCWNAAPGMGSIILAYFTSRVPGLELARGPLSPNRWKWAEERWRITERRRNRMDRGMRRGGDGRERVSLFSLSAVLKTTSPHNASEAPDGPPLIQTHARTICTAGLS